MDASTLYNLLKPHLDIMKASEKEDLSNLIIGRGTKSTTDTSRKISLNQAKEKLKEFRENNIKEEIN